MEPNLISIYVVLPVFNEEMYLEEAYFRLKNELEIRGFSPFFHYVDDGSTDSTREILKKLQALEKQLFVSQLRQNEGKGAAVRFGLSNVFTKCDVYGYTDADLDLDPQMFSQMIESVYHKHCDISVGNKTDARSEVKYPPLRRLLSYLFRKWTSMWLNLDLPDTQTGVKFFTDEVRSEILTKVITKSYAFDIEFLALANKKGFAINSFPISLRYSFDSSVSLRNSCKSLIDVLKIRQIVNSVDL